MEQRAYDNLKVIWDYMHMNMEPGPADCIVGFGNYNVNIALRAAELYRAGYAPRVLFTGGLGRNTAGMWTGSEAERFAAAAIAAGVPERDVIVEDRSTNTAENITFTREKLAALGLPVRRLLGVHQPFMERRIYAAMKVYWPEAELTVTSPQVDIRQYLRDAVAQGLEEKAAIDVIVGDFQRIELYAQKGWQIPQEVPEEAKAAFRALVELGYDGQLAK